MRSIQPVVHIRLAIRSQTCCKTPKITALTRLTHTVTGASPSTSPLVRLFGQGSLKRETAQVPRQVVKWTKETI